MDLYYIVSGSERSPRYHVWTSGKPRKIKASQVPEGVQLMKWGAWYNQVYLKSSHWESVKERAKKSNRCGWPTCPCGVTKNLHLHHKSYKDLGDEKLKQLIFLCEDCHKRVHEEFDKGGKRNLYQVTTKVVKQIKLERKKGRKGYNPHEVGGVKKRVKEQYESLPSEALLGVVEGLIACFKRGGLHDHRVGEYLTTFEVCAELYAGKVLFERLDFNGSVPKGKPGDIDPQDIKDLVDKFVNP